jgi:hypothetical protein
VLEAVAEAHAPAVIKFVELLNSSVAFVIGGLASPPHYILMS